MSVRLASSHALVALQLVAMVGVCLPLGATSMWQPLALGLLLVGIALGVLTLIHNRIGNFSIYPEPLDAARLITTGPYRWVRHPMYSAVLLLATGVALYHGHWLNGLSLLLLAAVLVAKIRREERLLRKKFSDYSDYASRTSRLVPGLW